MSSKIESSHKELHPNPNGNKRHIKEEVMVTEISTIGPHEWNILFDRNGKVKSKNVSIVIIDKVR